MDKELEALIDKVRDYKMSEDEIAEQRVSYAFGNTLDQQNEVSKDEVRNAIATGALKNDN